MKFERELISLRFYHVGNNLVYSSPLSEPLTAEQVGEVLKTNTEGAQLVLLLVVIE